MTGDDEQGVVDPDPQPDEDPKMGAKLAMANKWLSSVVME